MSSGSNYSVSELRKIVLARGEYLFQLDKKRFTAQKTRLRQRPDQTAVLTAERQDVNQLVSAASDAFAKARKLIEATGRMILGFKDLQQYFQQQLREQISASFIPIFDEIGLMLSNLEIKVVELEGIKIVATGKE